MTERTAATEPERILIVDDEPVVIQSLRGILEPDYRIFFATSGDQALEVARAQRPDLVLLDIVMPDVDGMTVCRRLKHDESLARVPVIFITGEDGAECEEQGLRAGAVDYIHKPVSPPVVKARVDNHVLLKRYRDQFETLSMEDALTGIPNRRYFDRMLVAEWRRARRNGTPLSLLALDIDSFKAYNDRAGHGAGDACLQRVASAVAGCAQRSADVMCRVGGEEFMCLLPETGPEGAAQVAERIRGAVETLAIPHPASGTPGIVTVSIGCCSVESIHDDHVDCLTTGADRALYGAKDAGRNRVRKAQAPWVAAEQAGIERGGDGSAAAQ